MCGIIGYTGMRQAADILLEGLSNLEYRGYDSAGISVCQKEGLVTVKTKGRLQDLADRIQGENWKLEGTCGIGHTRWATHGEPSERNSHPHNTDKLSLVHNGIIENYLELRADLLGKGYAFHSDTDTEVAARLIDHLYDGDPYAAINRALEQLRGSFAFGILFRDRPGAIYAVRRDSPLIVGLGEGENYIASDVPAILCRTRRYHLLEENEIARITRDRVEVRDRSGALLSKEVLTADWDIDAAQKGGFEHFMRKEIYEQPKALADTLHPRIREGLPCFHQDGLPEGFFSRFGKIHFVACGTAMHAGTVGKQLIERIARLPVEVDLASEFRYRDPILQGDCLVVAISQSGETADTLAALRLARSRGVSTLAIVNVIGSSLAREADYVLHTYAGPEIAVASTKAFTVQMVMTYLLAIAAAKDHGAVDDSGCRKLMAELQRAAGLLPRVLEQEERLEQLAGLFVEAHSVFYLGRGIDHALAMEGSLKLKEISYIHSESYAAGELKHGTISLITDGVPVVALVTQGSLLPKIISNIKEVRSRGGYVLVITRESFEIGEDVCDSMLQLPDAEDLFMPLLSVAALQLFAYHVSLARGCDVDKPRNLAKSVTVE